MNDSENYDNISSSNDLGRHFMQMKYSFLIWKKQMSSLIYMHNLGTATQANLANNNILQYYLLYCASTYLLKSAQLRSNMLGIVFLNQIFWNCWERCQYFLYTWFPHYNFNLYCIILNLTQMFSEFSLWIFPFFLFMLPMLSIFPM